jgi:flavin reductase (DIM6/NTAB) family NADH-FMN oxidoreductase RutF
MRHAMQRESSRFLICISETNHCFKLMPQARLLVVHLVGADKRELAELLGGEIGDEIDKFALCDW